jgi:hypothetical protein
MLPERTDSTTLGTLEPVDLRAVCTDEARSLTPWLSQPENLARLSKALDLELELEGIEVNVGPFKADIVATETTTDARVIVENQLEKTNHDHLGKIITYASGLRAKVIIWIAKEFTEEHRQAVDFLNEAAAPDLQIFTVALRLYRIGNSPPAPLFEMISSPNEFAATAKQEESGISERKALYLKFWTAFRDYCREKGSFLSLRKPRPQHWYNLAVGRSKFHIALTASTMHKRIGCEIYIRGTQAKKAFKLLEQQKHEIESQLGPLDWQELPDKQDCRIVIYQNDVDIANPATHTSAFEWLKSKAEAFHRTFSNRIKALPVADETETEAELEREAE